MISILEKEEVVHIARLAELLGISEMTVRRYTAELISDIQLAGSHLILRRGANPAYTLHRAAAINTEHKKAIGRRAAALINDGETIFLDCGTTTPFVADSIDKRLHFTAFCCSLNIARILSRLPNCTMHLSGGRWFPRSEIFFSRKALDELTTHTFNHTFISVGGVAEDGSLSCWDDSESEIKRAALSCAQRISYLFDSSKFDLHCSSTFASLASGAQVITDSRLSAAHRDFLQQKNVALITA